MDPSCSDAFSLVPFQLKIEAQTDLGAELETLTPMEHIKFQSNFVEIKEEKEYQEEEKTEKKLLPKAAPKQCLICGYPTTCLHYEAPSCHGKNDSKV
jgi:hypothetical protein